MIHRNFLTLYFNITNPNSKIQTYGNTNDAIVTNLEKRTKKNPTNRIANGQIKSKESLHLPNCTTQEEQTLLANPAEQLKLLNDLKRP